MSECRPHISLVIPTFNESTLLLRLLGSVEKLSNAAQVELVIVDDFSTDDTEALTTKWLAQPLPFFNARYIRQTRNQGPGQARNRGLQEARAPLTAFTDTDCVVEPRWLERLVAPLSEHMNWAGTGGRVLPLDPAPLTAQYFSLMHALEPPTTAQYLITCNSCFRTKPLRDVGGFTELSRIAGGEDIAASIRLWKAGWRFGIAEDAIVYHDYRPALREFHRTWRAYGRGTHAVFNALLTAEERSPCQPACPGDPNHWDGSLNLPPVTGVRSFIKDAKLIARHMKSLGIYGFRRLCLMALNFLARLAYLQGWREVGTGDFEEGEERLRKRI